MIHDTIKELHKKEVEMAVLAGITDERKRTKKVIKKFFKDNLKSPEIRHILLGIAKELYI